MIFPILQDIAVLFLFATVIILLCSKLNIPTIMGYLFTGFAVGPYTLKLIKDIHSVEVMAEVGIVLLLFAIGLEFSLKQLFQMRRLAILGGLLQAIFTIIGIFIVGKVFGLPSNIAIFAGMMISLSSTAIVLKILGERNELDTPHGRSIIAILIFQDIAVIPMMLLSPMLAGGNSSLLPLFITLGKIVVIVAVLFTLAKIIVPKLLGVVAKTANSELFLLTTILICMMIAFATSRVGLSLALGAFLAGLVVSESGYGYQAMGNISPFKDIFTGFFFISVGMMIDPGVFTNAPLLIIIAALCIILVKILAATGVMIVMGYPFRTSMITGVSLAQVGEFAFVMSGVGVEIGLIDREMNNIFIAVSVLTMAAAPYLIKGSMTIAALVEKLPLPAVLRKGYLKPENDNQENISNHIVIVGFGVCGRYLAAQLKSFNIEYIVIEMNPKTVQVEKQNQEYIIFGDASNEHVLHSAHIKTASMMVITMPSTPATQKAVELARRMAPSLSIIARAKYMTEKTALIQLGANEVIIEEFEIAMRVISGTMLVHHIPFDEILRNELELRKSVN